MIPRKDSMVTYWMTPAQSSVWWGKRRKMGDWCSCVPVQVKNAMICSFFHQVSSIICPAFLGCTLQVVVNVSYQSTCNHILWRKTSSGRRYFGLFWVLQNLNLFFSVFQGYFLPDYLPFEVSLRLSLRHCAQKLMGRRMKARCLELFCWHVKMKHMLITL